MRMIERSGLDAPDTQDAVATWTKTFHPTRSGTASPRVGVSETLTRLRVDEPSSLPVTNTVGAMTSVFRGQTRDVEGRRPLRLIRPSSKFHRSRTIV
ncbi:hypothetical protein [Mycobacterium botniense]|uniref:Uncharacterized protein n=1 Tax=Mycobacterium botniense TaxID=84962 RepID=A0A7I9Y3B3_9MYCO|nr:hypothetical protein [Mycobacterium botniense]GFG76514.1 hypothetical protein MBOT_38790 [Mycobacterium botniense]